MSQTNNIDASEVWRLAGIDQPIILASGSPRRAEILKSIGCPFEVFIPAIDEEKYSAWDNGELLQRSAVQKAEDIAGRNPAKTVLAADTVVRLDSLVFGKPGSSQEADDTLRALSGKTHEVWTALCLIREGYEKRHTGICSTTVAFRELSDAEIRAYIASGEPTDKAGSYGIQGMGALWVKRIEGCYFNVVGLPVSLFWDLLNAAKGNE